MVARGCLSNIWMDSGGVFSGAILGGFWVLFSGWFWRWFSGVFWRSISGGFVSPFRIAKKRRGGAGSGAGPAGRLVVFLLDFFGGL